MPEKKKGRNPHVSKGAKRTQCHIHDKVEEWEVRIIRKEVCVNDKPLIGFEGKHYCLVHLPTEEKDIEKFEEIFWARLEEVEKKIAANEKKPEKEREKGIYHSFGYLWFPSKVCLGGYKFLAGATFDSATFSADADFKSATFLAGVTFRSATFSADANFDSATFSDYANFDSATFSDYTDFKLATFSAEAYFKSATFSADASFSSATFSARAVFVSTTFSAEAYFRSATFLVEAYFNLATFSTDADFNAAKFTETSQVFFRQTRFCKTVNFNYAVFAGYVAFEGNKDESVFLNRKIVLKVRKELRKTFARLKQEFARCGIDFQIPRNFEKKQEAVLEFQDARLEKPERISFHRVRLCPSWFVNADSRKMVFADVSWDNLDAKFRNANIKAEINNLKERKVSDPSRLLEIACRQLAANAEENNRYEEASKLRYMAMETARLGYKWDGWFWKLHWLYWFSSAYGENWKRAILVLLSLILFFGVLYALPISTFDYGNTFHNMKLGDGLVHSLSVAAFQRPEPKPANALTSFFILLETIFAPLQAALLALAIRRKFMR